MESTKQSIMNEPTKSQTINKGAVAAARRILVTGGAGMIGSNLVHRLTSEGWDVWVVDNLWRGKLSNLQEENAFAPLAEERFINRDLRVPGVLQELGLSFDYIVHLADIVAGINYVFANEGLIFRDNILINSNVIADARALKPKGFLYVGTACSFPQELQTGPEAAPLREADQYPANPESAYGWSKLMGEYETFLLEKETGIPCSVLIFHNVYGSPCDYGERSQVIPSLIRKAIRFPEESFVVWGSGQQGRSFIHVDDVVDSIMLALQKGWGQGPVQIGTSHCTTIAEIAHAVVAASGKNIDIQFDTSKPEGDRGRCADTTKAKEVLGWEPKVSLQDGISRLYRWIEKRV
jgi:GDP-D-mannose 3',5'-epimerase